MADSEKKEEKKKKNIRDTFTNSVRDEVRVRCAGRCCNPLCGEWTMNLKSSKPVETGQCAHITAAAPGGPRYDASMKSAERSSKDNAIWLCSECHKVVDTCPDDYTTETLKGWKRDAEAATAAQGRENHWKVNPAFAALQRDDREAADRARNKSVVSTSENKSVASTSENKSVVSTPENKSVVSTPENKSMVSTFVDALAVQSLREYKFRWSGWMAVSLPTPRELRDLRKFTSEASEYGPEVIDELASVLWAISPVAPRMNVEQAEACLDLLPLVLLSSETLNVIQAVAEVAYSLWYSVILEPNSPTLRLINPIVVFIVTVRKHALKLQTKEGNRVVRDIYERMLDKVCEDMNRALGKDTENPLGKDMNCPPDIDMDGDSDKGLYFLLDIDMNSVLDKDMSCPLNMDMNIALDTNTNTTLDMDMDTNSALDTNANSALDMSTNSALDANANANSALDTNMVTSSAHDMNANTSTALGANTDTKELPADWINLLVEWSSYPRQSDRAFEIEKRINDMPRFLGIELKWYM